MARSKNFKRSVIKRWGTLSGQKRQVISDFLKESYDKEAETLEETGSLQDQGRAYPKGEGETLDEMTDLGVTSEKDQVDAEEAEVTGNKEQTVNGSHKTKHEGGAGLASQGGNKYLGESLTDMPEESPEEEMGAEPAAPEADFASAEEAPGEGEMEVEVEELAQELAQVISQTLFDKFGEEGGAEGELEPEMGAEPAAPAAPAPETATEPLEDEEKLNESKKSKIVKAITQRVQKRILKEARKRKKLVLKLKK